jgi:hypothetical protein
MLNLMILALLNKILNVQIVFPDIENFYIKIQISGILSDIKENISDNILQDIKNIIPDSVLNYCPRILAIFILVTIFFLLFKYRKYGYNIYSSIIWSITIEIIFPIYLFKDTISTKKGRKELYSKLFDLSICFFLFFAVLILILWTVLCIVHETDVDILLYIIKYLPIAFYILFMSIFTVTMFYLYFRVFFFVEYFFYFIAFISFMLCYALTGKILLEEFMIIFYPRMCFFEFLLSWPSPFDDNPLINNGALYVIPNNNNNIGINGTSSNQVSSDSLNQISADSFKLSSLELEYRKYFNLLSNDISKNYHEILNDDYMLYLDNYKPPKDGVRGGATWSENNHPLNLLSIPQDNGKYLNPTYHPSLIPQITLSNFDKCLFFIKSLSQFDKFVLSDDTFVNINKSAYSEKAREFLNLEYRSATLQLQESRNPFALKTIAEKVSITHLKEKYGYERIELNSSALYNHSLENWSRNRSDSSLSFLMVNQNYFVGKKNEMFNNSKFEELSMNLNKYNNGIAKPIYVVTIFPLDIPNYLFAGSQPVPSHIMYVQDLKNIYTYMLFNNEETISYDFCHKNLKFTPQNIQYTRNILTLSPKYALIDDHANNRLSIVDYAKKSQKIKIYTNAFSRDMIKDAVIINSTLLNK